MAGEKMNWDSVETWQRVVASMIAAQGGKVDLKATAKFYGTTYDTLENKFRKLKKTATELKDEVESGQRGEVVRSKSSNPSTPRKPKTPSKQTPLGHVTNGRVSKTPSRRNNAVKIESSSSSSTSPLYDDSSSFDDHGSFLVPDTTDPTLHSFTHDYDFFNPGGISVHGGMGMVDSTFP